MTTTPSQDAVFAEQTSQVATCDGGEVDGRDLFGADDAFALELYEVHASNGEPIGSIYAACPEEAAVLSAKERDVSGRELLCIDGQWIMVVVDSKSTRAFESVAPRRDGWDL